MKTKILYWVGLICLYLLSGDWFFRVCKFHTITGSISQNRGKFMLNLHGYMSIRYLLGIISMISFFMILTSMEKAPFANKKALLKKIAVSALFAVAVIITLINLFSLM